MDIEPYYNMPEISESFHGTPIDQLWSLYREYIDSFVVGNRELKQVAFHTLLGNMLTMKGVSYIESGKNKSTRTHLFILQSSGTGKSELMKACDALLNAMDIPSEYTIKYNEAALTGTIYLADSGEIVPHRGALSHIHALFWDEGSVMLKGSSHMDVLTDVLQGVMDEPGYVCKGMRLGTLKYKTSTTVIAGSYIFDEFKHTILTTGFLQRMFICWKRFTEEEKASMRRGVSMLKTIQNKQRIDQLTGAFKNFNNNLTIPTNDGTIAFDKDAVTIFTQELEEMFEKRINRQYVGLKQEILETFFNRVHGLIDRVAVQVAIINGNDVVGLKELRYGRDLCGYHLMSILSFLDTIKSDMSDEIDKRKGIVLKVVQSYGNLTPKTELIKKLSDVKKSGKWDYGVARTGTFIKKMVADGDLRMDCDFHNAKLLSVRR